MMTGTATVLTVRNIGASIAYYRDALGFAVTFEYGQPTFYACLCRDEAALHLIAANETKRHPGHGALCIFVEDVDAFTPNWSRATPRWSSRRRTTTTACAISTWSISTAIRFSSAWRARRRELSSSLRRVRRATKQFRSRTPRASP